MKLGNKLNSIRNWGLPYVKPVFAWNQSFQRNILKVVKHLARICPDHLILNIKNPGLWVRSILPVAKVSHHLLELGTHGEVRMLRTTGLLICKTGLLLQEGMWLGFHGSFSQPFQQVLLSHPCTQVTALAVSSVRIKFPFVPLFYEVISTSESDISLPLGLRDFFSMFVTLCVFFKICPSQVCRSSWVEWAVYRRGRFRAQGQGYGII